MTAAPAFTRRQLITHLQLTGSQCSVKNKPPKVWSKLSEVLAGKNEKKKMHILSVAIVKNFSHLSLQQIGGVHSVLHYLQMLMVFDGS